ncbi:MAG: helix-turn-helix transcriptional regulator [Chitinophagaceae bacterium]|jgi:transcriptional regulator with XRE-family HTH domain|nr:helix-turn-helix transcriptional regulator [Chitinophagaceae bacterium]
MIKKKKILKAEALPEFKASVDAMPEDSKIFVDKSLEIAHYIFRLMDQKGMKQKDLASKMGKTEAELSKILAGMHNLTLRSVAKLEAALGATIICTPVNKKIAFPKLNSERTSYAVSEKKPERTAHTLSGYGMVVQMNTNNGFQNSSQAI